MLEIWRQKFCCISYIPNTISNHYFWDRKNRGYTEIWKKNQGLKIIGKVSGVQFILKKYLGMKRIWKVWGTENILKTSK